MARASKAQRERDVADARELLDKLGIKEGSTVYTMITHVARSGMSRRVRVLIVSGGEIVDVSCAVGRVIGRQVRRESGEIVVGGCGFDAGFDVVHALSYAMHGYSFEGVPDSAIGDDTRQRGYTLRHGRL